LRIFAVLDATKVSASYEHSAAPRDWGAKISPF
jgi:hypothetical protein